ncbi:unnamed protein product [Lymnaea stagnalis]|uniref:Ig-like domain-containing protein n=1 Tax=Lymnaea stagnalis TaxID=6523 RepID=A0AAV2H8G9_LYMST
MTSYNVLIPLALFLILAVDGQKTCFLSYQKPLNVSCDVKGHNATNLTWSLFDTESNRTLIINICEATVCHPLIPRLAIVPFMASVTSENSGKNIQSSTLNANVRYANLKKLSTFRQLQCQYNDNTITLCDSLDVYVNPTKINVDELDTGRDGDAFQIRVETNNLFPLAEFTLYVDNMTVEPNSSLILAYDSDVMTNSLYTNPESMDRFENVYEATASCVYVLNVTDLGHGLHQLRITASAKTNDQDINVVMTDAMSINFDWRVEIVPLCNYPEVVNNDVTITCRSDVLSFYEGCEFEILTNGTSFRVIYNKDIKFKYADLLGVSKFMTECQTTWNTTYLGPGYHEFRVSMVAYNTMGNLTRSTSTLTTPLTLANVYVPGCYQVVTGKAVIISCRENLTSEAVGCEYQIKTNGYLTQVKGDIKLGKFTTHLNEESSTVSECNLTVKPSDLGLGYHQFCLTIVTNDTNQNLTRITFDFTSPIFFYLPALDIGPYSDVYRSDGTGKWICDLKTTGNPHGSFRWTGVLSNGTLSTATPGDSLLSHTNLSLEIYTNFSCQPLSVLSDDLPKQYASVLVNQKQQLLSFRANGKERQLVVEMDSYVTLECLASGFPVPGIQFRQVGKHGTMATNSPYYTFKVSSCLDGGRYECDVRQWSSYQSLESQIEIIVKCPQMIRNANQYPRQFHTNVNGNLEVTIPVSGYPEPNHYTLLRLYGNQTVAVTSGYSVIYQWDDNPDGTVVLSFTDVQDDFFTNYTLVFGNGIGSDQEYSFYLTKVNQPEGSDSGDNVGAIVGGVCGGVAGVVLIIVIIYYVKISQKYRIV